MLICWRAIDLGSPPKWCSYDSLLKMAPSITRSDLMWFIVKDGTLPMLMMTKRLWMLSQHDLHTVDFPNMCVEQIDTLGYCAFWIAPPSRTNVLPGVTCARIHIEQFRTLCMKRFMKEGPGTMSGSQGSQGDQVWLEAEQTIRFRTAGSIWDHCIGIYWYILFVWVFHVFPSHMYGSLS